MTTIDIAGSHRSPTSYPTRLRLTARGRRALAVVASLPAVVALSIAVISGGGALASGDAGEPVSFESVTVMTGDTLWSIAGHVAPTADPRDVVDDIMRLNALSSASLDAGQTIAIPAEYASGR